MTSINERVQGQLTEKPAAHKSLKQLQLSQRIGTMTHPMTPGANGPSTRGVGSHGPAAGLPTPCVTDIHLNHSATRPSWEERSVALEWNRPEVLFLRLPLAPRMVCLDGPQQTFSREDCWSTRLGDGKDCHQSGRNGMALSCWGDAVFAPRSAGTRRSHTAVAISHGYLTRAAGSLDGVR